MHFVIRAAGVWGLAIAASLPAASLHAQGSATLDAVAGAMGGRDRVLAVRTLVVEGSGDNFNFGQNPTPEAPLPRFEVSQSRRSIDFANRRWFLDQTRAPRYPTGNTAVQRQRVGLDDTVAYNIGADGAMLRVGGPTAMDRADELLDHPVGFLQAALGPDARVVEDAVRGATRVVRLTWRGRGFTMLVDTATMLPLRIQRITDNALLGDLTLDTEFQDWREVDGLKLPMRVAQKLDGRWTVSDLRYASAVVNGDIGDLAATDSVRASQPPAPVVNVTVEEIAPGVWYLNGQTHHSVAIETSRSIVLVEAPQSDARTLAVIDSARTLRPGKPVDLVINTHHHFDHSGGIRAAISQGLTILTHQGNREFYERSVYPRRHTIAPDALTRNPKPLRLMTVADKYVRRDSLRTIELYRVDGSQHSGSMLMVYLPAEKLLIQADLYNPPPANATTPVVFPFAANLLENIQRRGLVVERVVGIHGRVVPLAEIEAAATRAP